MSPYEQWANSKAAEHGGFEAANLTNIWMGEILENSAISVVQIVISVSLPPDYVGGDPEEQPN